ncbi:MAG: magnesium/cobalt transporter CorA [Bacteroidales bacterium]
MARFLKKRDKTTGLMPGSLVFLGNKKQEHVRISSMIYNEKELIRDYIPITDKVLPDIPEHNNILWLNIDGLHDTSVIKQVGEKYDLHPLMLEDILNTDQRPKHEDFDNTLLISMKMLRFHDKNNTLETEQISLVIKNNVLLSFQEQSGDLFNPLHQRINNNKGRIRRSGTDYLGYAIMDSIVDNYLNIIGKMGEKIEDMEEHAIKASDRNIPSQIYHWKRELRYLHRAVMPFRDMLLKMLKMGNGYFDKDTDLFFKDLLDLSQQALESTETYRDLLSDYYNIYNVGISNRMNDVMKVLTVFASIFIPLTFIAGVYGTNFEHIPELSYPSAYFIMWGVFITIIVIMIIFFRRRGWL